MMQKHSRGTSSKSGVLKPRNVAVTPGYGSSLGIPKYRQAETEKKSQIPRRSSSDRIARISLAPARITPSKFNTPVQSNHFLAPPSAASCQRQSFDSVRSSFGGKTRKEGFPVGDPAYKTQCIDKILEFLGCYRYDGPYNRNMLKLPTGRDFASVFGFIYKHVDSTYKLPQRYEDEIPKLLKALKYPVQMSKSSFINVGSPHTWPSVLAMLGWLIDIVEFYNSFDSGNVAHSKDFDSCNLSKKRFELLVATFHADSEIEKQDIMKDYKDFAFQDEGVLPEHLIALQNDELKLTEELEDITCVISQVDIVHQQANQIFEDKEKLLQFIEDLKQHISVKDSERSKLQEQADELENKAELIKEEISKLQLLKSQQNLSSAELDRIKNQAGDLKNMICHQQNEEKELKDEIWNCQLEMGRSEESLNKEVYNYNSLCKRLQLEDCVISSSNVEASLSFMENEVLPVIKEVRRKTKEDAFEIQKNVMSKKTEREKIEEKVHGIEIEGHKLERKEKRLEEEIQATRNEMSIEEQHIQKDYDRLNDEISLARRMPKKSLYEIQTALEEAKKRYECIKLKDDEVRREGKRLITDTEEQVKTYFAERKSYQEKHNSEIRASAAKALEKCLKIMEQD